MPPTTTTNPTLVADIERASRRYRDEHHLHANIDLATGHIVLPIDGIVAAITMPPELGRRVLAGLRVRLLAGPVIECPATRRWIFLTGPDQPRCDTTLADLHRLDVIVCPRGEQIILPSPADERIGIRHWANPPSQRDIPPQSAVISTTRAMAHHSDDQR